MVQVLGICSGLCVVRPPQFGEHPREQLSRVPCLPPCVQPTTWGVGCCAGVLVQHTLCYIGVRVWQ